MAVATLIEVISGEAQAKIFGCCWIVHFLDLYLSVLAVFGIDEVSLC